MLEIIFFEKYERLHKRFHFSSKIFGWLKEKNLFFFQYI